MEKIKDFLHDFSDIFFAMIIAGVMFAVLAVNLGGWFNSSFSAVSANEPTNTSRKQNNNAVNNKSNDNDVSPEDEDNQSKVEDDTNKTETEKLQNDTGPVINEEGQENETPEETKKITIPEGTFCTGIAKILKENKLIDDESSFIRAAESLSLSGRLKSGSFEIPVNTTEEDMVKIIAGQKKM